MVMEEMPAPRATHVLMRGQYDQPGPGRAGRASLSFRRRGTPRPTGWAWPAGWSNRQTR